MAIMAADERNDARGAAWLLASTARDCVRDPDSAPGQQVTLNNVYRLLEAYRLNPLFGADLPVDQSPENEVGTLTLMPPVERHVKDVRQAIECAMGNVFSGLSKDQAIEEVEEVLRCIAYPHQDQIPEEERRNKAALFFDQVALRLGFS